MKIKSAYFDNYRNLTGLTISFNDDISYIVGENNIGKSNILNAINGILNNYKFSEQDFYDCEKPITVELSLSLSDDEIGMFGDLIDPETGNSINLIISQSIDDLYLSVKHKESQTEINSKILKQSNVIYYDSIRNPKNELTFDKTKGAGLFLNYIIKNYINQQGSEECDFVKKDNINEVLTYIEDTLNKINIVKDNQIKPSFNLSNIDFLSKIFSLQDSKNIDIKNSGYGIQYSLLIIFALLEKIINIKKTCSETNLNAILMFDEPEIHLHPFAQRTLINKIKKIATGTDTDFNTILKDMFGIESFSAQIIIVSHSDRIVGSNFKNIIRLYKENSNIKSISGALINFEDNDKNLEKHLILQTPYFAEALFARFVIIVEGASEYGALKKMAEKMNIDLDEKGISIVKADGKDSIIPLIKLFEFFKIQVIAIKDRDLGVQDTDIEYIEKGLLKITNERDFETELLADFKNFDNLIAAINEYGVGINIDIQAPMAEKYRNKYNLNNISTITSNLHWEDISENLNLTYLFLLSRLTKEKSVTLGLLIGEYLDKDNIPVLYKDILNLAKDKTQDE